MSVVGNSNDLEAIQHRASFKASTSRSSGHTIASGWGFAGLISALGEQSGSRSPEHKSTQALINRLQFVEDHEVIFMKGDDLKLNIHSKPRTLVTRYHPEPTSTPFLGS